MENEDYYTTNNVAGVIKGLAVFIAIIGIISSIIGAIIAENILIAIIGGVVSVLSVLLLYASGELIEIMHDIRTNSEHIRDYLERNK